MVWRGHGANAQATTPGKHGFERTGRLHPLAVLQDRQADLPIAIKRDALILHQGAPILALLLTNWAAMPPVEEEKVSDNMKGDVGMLCSVRSGTSGNAANFGKSLELLFPRRERCGLMKRCVVH